MNEITQYILASVGQALNLRSVDFAEYVIYFFLIGAGLYHARVGGDWMTRLATHWRTALYVLAAIVAVRLVFSQYYLYEDVKSQRDSLTAQLQAEGVTRDLVYRDLSIAEGHTLSVENGHTVRSMDCAIDTIFQFENKGDPALKVTFYDLVLTADGVTYNPPGNITTTVDGKSPLYFRPVSIRLPSHACVAKYPKEIDVGFEVKYDNLPPIHQRHVHRVEQIVVDAPNRLEPTNDLINDED
jgi:hypothetical protein